MELELGVYKVIIKVSSVKIGVGLLFWTIRKYHEIYIST